MRSGQDSGHSLDSVILLFVFGLFVFFSPFTSWWASVTTLWYLPYLLWLGMIVLIAWVVHRRGDDV